MNSNKSCLESLFSTEKLFKMGKNHQVNIKKSTPIFRETCFLEISNLINLVGNEIKQVTMQISKLDLFSFSTYMQVIFFLSA